MDGLNKFIIENNIIGTMAGVAIALYTKDLILSFSGDILIPTITTSLLKLNIKFLTDILPKKSFFNFKIFLQNLISWILGVLVTYIFIQYTVKKILGIDDHTKNNNPKSNSNVY